MFFFMFYKLFNFISWAATIRFIECALFYANLMKSNFAQIYAGYLEDVHDFPQFQGIGSVSEYSMCILRGLSYSNVLLQMSHFQGIGNVSECAEFNFHADPEAAHAVLRLTRFFCSLLIIMIIIHNDGLYAQSTSS